ncbi:putative septum site-determining protein MinC [Clostridia bacterium]|nr:putative septum site-determining protein MinC [Clostridia bacterium]
MAEKVVIKGITDGFALVLPDTEDFDALKAAVAEKLSESRSFFEGGEASLTFRGRAISPEEEQELKELINVKSGMTVRYFKEKVEQKRAEVVTKDTVATPDIDELMSVTVDENENHTKFYRGSLRSGQSLSFSGSVIIVGDVNPGAEVVAAGNIIVLGSLRGMAHAGSCGNESCFAAALTLSPTQLRIGSRITYFPSEKLSFIKKKKEAVPSMATVRNDRIVVTELSYGNK